MSAKVYYEKDADLSHLQGKKIAVIGYGSQGRAHALNMHDSGLSVTVAVRPAGKGAKQAQADGLPTQPLDKAVQGRRLNRLPAARPGAGRGVPPVRGAHLPPGPDAAVCPRLQRALRPDRAPGRRGRDHGGAQEPWQDGARSLRGRPGHALSSWPWSRTPRARPRPMAWPTLWPSAGRGPASSRPPSRRRPRPISSASRRCSAAGSAPC